MPLWVLRELLGGLLGPPGATLGSQGAPGAVSGILWEICGRFVGAGRRSFWGDFVVQFCMKKSLEFDVVFEPHGDRFLASFS